MSRIQYHIKKTEGEERTRWISEYKQVRAKFLFSPPCANHKQTKKSNMFDMQMIFLIGVNGSRYDCTEIKRKLTEFILEKLKMELSDHMHVF